MKSAKTCKQKPPNTIKTVKFHPDVVASVKRKTPDDDPEASESEKTTYNKVKASTTVSIM